MTILLSSCAVAPLQMPSSPGKNRLLAANLTNWHAQGKIGVQSIQDSGSASFDWQQHANLYRIKLAGPLGLGNIDIQSNAGNVLLIAANGKTYTAATPETLLWQTTGWRLPISNLKYWIRGLPVPHQTTRFQYNKYGLLTDLKQNAWQIQFANYTNVDGIFLPNKIWITSANLKIKILVYQWELGGYAT